MANAWHEEGRIYLKTGTSEEMVLGSLFARQLLVDLTQAIAEQDRWQELHPTDPKFPITYCSHCGLAFGPGNSGFSNCRDHRGLRSLTSREEMAIKEARKHP